MSKVSILLIGMATLVGLSSCAMADVPASPQPLQWQYSFNADGVAQATYPGVVVSNGSVINVAVYGAGQGNPAQDQAGFEKAIAVACATSHDAGRGGVTEVDIPNGTYTIGTPLTLCDNLHLHGLGGYPVITFTGTGLVGSKVALFLNPGKRNIEIDHLEWKGQFHNYAYGYQSVAGTGSALNVRIHDNLIYDWGTVANSGGGITFDTDSQSNAVYNNAMEGTGFLIQMTAPTDRMHIYDNVMDSLTGAVCVVGINGGGAQTIFVQHNNFICDGGAMSVYGAGSWIITDNEYETPDSAPFLGNNAVYDLGTTGFVQFVRNNTNAHLHAGYDVWVSNAIQQSVFRDNIGWLSSIAQFHIGNGLANIYDANVQKSAGVAQYDGAYIGIINNTQLVGVNGMGWGCGSSTAGLGSFSVCNTVTQSSALTTDSLNGNFLTPGLTNGHAANVSVGTSFSNFNAVDLSFNQVAGAGSASNTASLGIVGGTPVTVASNGGTMAGAYVGSTTVYTVAGLPTCNLAARGERAQVSDANSVTFSNNVTGGGAFFVPVICNAFNWIIG